MLELRRRSRGDRQALLPARSDFLFLGRGINYPIALEGALKLKEISYIHAEGYAAGEMKHGPIALIDEEMPVVVLAPRDAVYEKIARNMQEVKARERHASSRSPTEGDRGIRAHRSGADHVITVPQSHPLLHAGADRSSRCSCSRTTSPSAAAATSISRATSRRASRSSKRRGSGV